MNFWVDLTKIGVRRRVAFVKAADQNHARIVVNEDDAHAARDGFLVLKGDTVFDGEEQVAHWHTIASPKDQQAALQIEGRLVVEGKDWAVIPIENLIAQRHGNDNALLAVADSLEDAKRFLWTLETGVDGVVLRPKTAADVVQVGAAIRERQAARAARQRVLAEAPPSGGLPLAPAPESVAPSTPPAEAPGADPHPPQVPHTDSSKSGGPDPQTDPAGPDETRPDPASPPAEAQPPKADSKRKPKLRKGLLSKGNRLALHVAKVTGIEDAGMADRVCVDATTAFEEDEGVLVGSTGRCQLLVVAETRTSGYIAARPFRVNAGALHAYIVAPESKTRYLSEMAAGQSVLAVKADGTTRPIVVGRAKIEPRPHLLVKWKSESSIGSMVLQFAETVRILGPDGSVPVTDLKVGQEILVYPQKASRHAGHAVDGQMVEQ